MIIHVHPDSSATFNADEALDDRAYDFNQGDQRVTLEEHSPVILSRAVEVATKRARETGLTQQAKLVGGPLIDRQQWLIQSVPVKYAPFDLDDDLRPFVEAQQEAVRNLVAQLPELPELEEIPEPEPVAFTEVRDFVNMIFEDTSLELVDYSHYSDRSVWLRYEVDEGDEALTSIAAHVADRFVDGRKVRLPE